MLVLGKPSETESNELMLWKHNFMAITRFLQVQNLSLVIKSAFEFFERETGIPSKFNGLLKILNYWTIDS